MTVVSVVCNERRWYIFVAPKAPLLSGEVPEEAWALRAISLTNNYEFSFLPRGALFPGLVQESKNNTSFRFFAVEKGCIAERVPGREKTGIQFLRSWMRDWPHSLCSSRMELQTS